MWSLSIYSAADYWKPVCQAVGRIWMDSWTRSLNSSTLCFTLKLSHVYCHHHPTVVFRGLPHTLLNLSLMTIFVKQKSPPFFKPIAKRLSDLPNNCWSASSCPPPSAVFFPTRKTHHWHLKTVAISYMKSQYMFPVQEATLCNNTSLDVGLFVWIYDLFL